ncbi:MAG: sigma-54 dependent transcriptional regulator [Longimicrobiales bacterium]|nr:sigma-54 dependent transcriptional regulator [Longimicrobiales bacterium]
MESAAESAGLELRWASSLSDLLEALGEEEFVATLISLEEADLEEALARRIGQEGNAGSLFLSASGASFDRALLAERCGAVALLQEPLEEKVLEARLGEVLDEGVEVPLPDLPDEARDAPRLVGSSRALANVFETVARVAPTSATVLITGESGTGKELVARSLHHAGERADEAFVPVNCAAIPESLLEAELFGHEKGAFTGAVARRVGRFERAQGGTLFLDEIGDMSLVLQAKLLRALEDRVIERVGGEEPISLDVRIVAATNRDLRESLASGDFREDLYYRLAVVEVELPPLRERPGDVRELALHFAALFAARYGRDVTAVTERAIERLEEHSWPGNVRELRNVMDRAVLLARGSVIRAGDLRLGEGSPRRSPRSPTTRTNGYPPTQPLEVVEADHIRRVLEHTDGHLTRAAEILGIHRNTLARKIGEYGLDQEEE